MEYRKGSKARQEKIFAKKNLWKLYTSFKELKLISASVFKCKSSISQAFQSLL